VSAIAIAMKRQIQVALILAMSLGLGGGPDAIAGSSRSKSAKHSARTVSIEDNSRVQAWIHYFTQRDRERFQRFLSRGSRYKSLVQSILKKNGLPEEFYYLAMIESGYVTHARSHAHAVGIWQFIAATGKQYGLLQNGEVDERRDVVRATQAAALYLKDLYRTYRSWPLAMAAYNAGEGRINQAIQRAGTRNFWTLARRGFLPNETENYVPKFYAAALIGKNPTKYGLQISLQPELKFPKKMSVRGGTSLQVVAQRTGVSVEVLQSLNPHLRASRVPSSMKRYSLWVPKGTSTSASSARLAQE